MSISAIDIIEIKNDQKALLFKISIVKAGQICFDYYASMSEDRFSIRRNYMFKLEEGNTSAKSISDYQSIKNDFVFRIDMTNEKNIETEIRRLSLIKHSSDKQEYFQIMDDDIIDKHFVYLLYHFTEAKYNHKQRGFNIDLLFLIFLNKLIELSVDDSIQSNNCQHKLQMIAKPPLGNFLVKRMMFYKYAYLFYSDIIKAWEQSVKVNMALHEFYYLLLENSLENHFEPNHIANRNTFWFSQPEDDLNYFLKFTRDSGFTFNE